MRSSHFHFVPRSDWLIFLATVGLSLTLLFVGKDPSATAIKRDIGGGVAYLAKPVLFVVRTFGLWRENNILRDRVVSLMHENSELRDAALENFRLRAMLDFRERFPLPLVSAEVVGYPGLNIGGRLLIDAGWSCGVRINSAVITPAGLVGKIVEVGENSSVVQTLVGNAFGVSVLVERSRVAGILRWVGPNDWRMIGLSTGDDVRPGDLILTTGAGTVFPKGIRVGVVSKIEVPTEARSGWVHVEPFLRFSAVEEVFVVIAPEQEGVPSDSVASAGIP